MKLPMQDFLHRGDGLYGDRHDREQGVCSKKNKHLHYFRDCIQKQKIGTEQAKIGTDSFAAGFPSGKTRCMFV